MPFKTCFEKKKGSFYYQSNIKQKIDKWSCLFEWMNEWMNELGFEFI